MDTTQVYIPFAKKDEEKRLVYGYASTEALDSQEEVVEKNAIMEALPGYMKFGNIREMHQPIAVGKTHQANIDDKGLFIKVKVVDDNAWNKVKEGVYNGFSIGGRVVSKVGNKIKALTLTEISIVDRPANPEAVFSVVKADNLKTTKMEEMEEIDTDEMKEMEMKMTEMSEFASRQVSIMEVSQVISIARDLIYMISDRIWEGKPYADLEAAVDSLKEAATVCLGQEESEEMSEKMNNIIDMVKSQKENPESYAYISKTGEKHLPIASEELIKSSVTNFPQVSFESEDHKILAARIIKSVADANKTQTNSMIEKYAKKSMRIELAKEYIPVYRENRYFDVMKKVIG